MATIVTVHGTFATGPREGDMWWQQGSPFSKSILNLIEATDGDLSYEPFIWDGANLETSRRSAGQSLSNRMLELEQQQTPFTVIGHSHGGSVISAALMEAAKRRRPFSSLRHWISIGSPFITTKRGPFLFHRLGVFGKSAYVAILTIFLVLCTSLFLPANLDQICPASNLFSLSCATNMAKPLLLFLIPFALFYAGLRYIESRRLHLYNARVTEFARTTFKDRWVAFWHPNDEAIRGLESLKKVNLEIFAKDFAVKPLSALSIVILPLAYLLLISSPPAMVAVHAHAKAKGYTFVQGLSTPDGALTGSGNNILVNNQLALEAIGSGLSDVLKFALRVKPMENGREPTWLMFLTLFTLPILAIGTAAAFTYLFNRMCLAISATISRALNPVTMGQIRAQAFGSDTLEDFAVDAQHWPMWLGEGMPPLPQKLSDEIQGTSDAAVTRAVPKFRDAARTFATANANDTNSDLFSSYLTWEELIHTTYFSNPRFAKLVAYAICQGEGFRPSATFRDDPDFNLVAQWFNGVLARKPPQHEATARP